MLNNQGTEAKFNVTIPLDGTTGIKGDPNGFSCFVETKIRLEVNNVGLSNSLYFQGRIRNSSAWHEIATITGPSNEAYDVSTYDYVRFVILIADGVGEVIGAGFLLSSSSGGGGAGDASAANQVTGNNLLTQINNKTPGSLLANKLYDKIQMSYTSTTDVFSYYSGVTLTATTTVTYTDSTKSTVDNVQVI